MTRMELWNEINDNHADLLFRLKERWMDESEYEDIAEYLKVIQQKLPQATAITKRPFGIKLKADDGNLKVDVVVEGMYIKLRAKSI